MSETPDALSEGDLVAARFTLERRLGEGGYGVVWLATDRDGTSVALKILRVTGQRMRDRFLREAEILEKLDHPNIARLCGLHQAEPYPAIALEYVRGRSFDQFLSERALVGQDLSGREIAQLFEQIASAVRYAHERGVVHRDLKPRNLMLIRDGAEIRVKVLDFGIAKILKQSASDETTVGRMLGSIRYASPEQLQSVDVDARSDVFSLGVILFELLTLRRAWDEDQHSGEKWMLQVLERMRRGPTLVVSAWRQNVPHALDAAVKKAVSIARADRFLSVEDFMEAVRPALLALDAPVAKSSSSDETAVKEAIDSPSLLTWVRPVDWVEGEEEIESESGTENRFFDPPGPLPPIPSSIRLRPIVVAAVLVGFGVMSYSFTAAYLLEQPSRVPLATTDIPAFRPGTPIAVQRTEQAETEQRPALKHDRPRPRPAPFRAPPTEVVRKEAVELRAILERIKTDPSNAPSIAKLRDRILEAARTLPDREQSISITRRATASAMAGDLEGLEVCVREIEARQR